VGASVLGAVGAGLGAAGRGLGAAWAPVRARVSRCWARWARDSERQDVAWVRRGAPKRGLGGLGHGLGASSSTSGNNNGLISDNSNGLVSVSSELNVTIVHHCAACRVQGNEGNVNPAGNVNRPCHTRTDYKES
jgi:broad specificity phosphatase PhoE